MCFQIDGKYAYTDKCVKSRIVNKVTDCVLSTDKFEQKCVVIKGILKSLRLKDHMKTIGMLIIVSQDTYRLEPVSYRVPKSRT